MPSPSKQLQALQKQLSAAKTRHATLQSAIAEARNMVFMLIEKQASCATGPDGGEDLEQTYQLLQIFAKTSQLLQEHNSKMESDLAKFEARNQVQRQNLQDLYQQAQVFMETQSYEYPGSAAGAYNFGSLSELVGAQY